MARYFTPATVEAIEAAGGRPIGSGYHSEVVARLRPDECLAWHLDRGRFQMVSDATDIGIYANFVDQMLAGGLVSLGFYAMPKASPGWDKGFDWDRRTSGE